MVLHVGLYLRVALGDAAELGLPIAVQDDPVDVALPRVGLPTALLGSGEVDVGGRAGGIEWIEQHLDRPVGGVGPIDCRGDALAGHVGQLLVHELGPICVASALQAGFEPLLDNCPQFAEKVDFGLLVGIPPLGVEQSLGEVVLQGGLPEVGGVDQVKIDGLLR